MTLLWHYYDFITTLLQHYYNTIISLLFYYYECIITLLYQYYDNIIHFMTKCHHHIYLNMQTAFLNLNNGKWKWSDNELWSLISTNRPAPSYHGKHVEWVVLCYYTHYFFHYTVYCMCLTRNAAALIKSAKWNIINFH